MTLANVNMHVNNCNQDSRLMSHETVSSLVTTEWAAKFSCVVDQQNWTSVNLLIGNLPQGSKRPCCPVSEAVAQAWLNGHFDPCPLSQPHLTRNSNHNSVFCSNIHGTDAF